MIRRDVEKSLRDMFERGYKRGHEDAIRERKGEWVFDDECHEHGHCSKCGYGKVDLVDGKIHNFCPNCGADMRGVSE